MTSRASVPAPAAVPARIAAVVALGLFLACGRPVPGGRSEEDRSAIAGRLSEGVRDTVSVGATPGNEEEVAPARRPERSTGLENFAIANDPRREAAVDTVPLVIENGAGVPIAVAARAGAAPVVIDTLAPGERHRVNLVGPAPRIELVWVEVAGSRAGTTRLPSVAADSVVPIRLGDLAQR